MEWISLFVFKSKTRTFEFSSAVAKRRLPATSTTKWSKSPSWSSGSGMVFERESGDLSCANAPITKARNTTETNNAIDLFTLTSKCGYREYDSKENWKYAPSLGVKDMKSALNQH